MVVRQSDLWRKRSTLPLSLADDGKVDEAKTLLQGAIHEYDRFMRQRPEEDRNSEFYRCAWAGRLGT